MHFSGCEGHRPTTAPAGAGRLSARPRVTGSLGGSSLTVPCRPGGGPHLAVLQKETSHGTGNREVVQLGKGLRLHRTGWRWPRRVRPLLGH
ncbi:hypothetical protein [Ornithinimicrobium kibberense]|uniref:hypothetical protein n=1 Tax=Ornithinimicrobium kibberense TaxID=282060 RepID=UPI003608383D